LHTTVRSFTPEFRLEKELWHVSATYHAVDENELYLSGPHAQN